MTTIALAGSTGSRIRSASSCRSGSRVVRTGLPGVGGSSCSTRESSSVRASTTRPGCPASSSSYRLCSPDRPVWSPTDRRPSDSLIISAVASPTVPSRARANSRVGASGRSSGSSTAPGSPGSTGAAARARPTRAGRWPRRRPPVPRPTTSRRTGRRRRRPVGERTRRACPLGGPPVLSMPTRSTGRSVTSTSSSMPRISPRSGSTGETTSCSPGRSSGASSSGDQVARHVPSTTSSSAVVV
jgi:hypothetical protein